MSEPAIERIAPGRLAVRGALDFDTAAAALSRGLQLSDGEQELEIDLSGLDSGDSAGLAVLIEWMASAQARGAKLRYVGVPEQMLTIARICGLDRLLLDGTGGYGAGGAPAASEPGSASSGVSGAA